MRLAFIAGNNVTQSFFLPITLIACMVGLASVLAGIHHMRLFRSDSLAAAAASSLIAWLLVLLAMGYVNYCSSPQKDYVTLTVSCTAKENIAILELARCRLFTES